MKSRELEIEQIKLAIEKTDSDIVRAALAIGEMSGKQIARRREIERQEALAKLQEDAQ